MLYYVSITKKVHLSLVTKLLKDKKKYLQKSNASNWLITALVFLYFPGFTVSHAMKILKASNPVRC